MTLAVTQLVGFGGFTESAGSGGANLTAGTLSGGAVGFATGAAPVSSGGSIDQEPYPGETLIGFYTEDTGKGIILYIWFDGSITSELSGVTKAVVDSVQYTLTSAWTVNTGRTTSNVYPYSGGMFVASSVYAVGFA